MAVITHVGDVFQVRVLYNIPPNDQAMNVLHYKLDNVSVPGGGLWAGAPTYDVAPLLAEEVFDLLAPKWAVFASNRVSMRKADAQNISPPPKSAVFVHDPGAGEDGLVIDEAIPLQDAITVLKRTALAGRKYMGRVYVPGFPETAQANGTVDAGVITAMEPFVNALSQIVDVPYLGDTLHFFPVLYAVDPGPPIVERVTNIISTEVSDATLKTMRSRRPGKGS